MQQDTETIVSTMTQLSFGASLACARRLQQLIEEEARADPTEINGEATVKFLNFHMVQIAHEAEQLESRLLDEIGAITTFSLSPEERLLIDLGRSQFDENVALSLPDTVFDLDEACRCMAFGRYTASVFHLMRGVEAALLTVADRVSTTIQDKNGSMLPWGIVTANLKVEIDKMPKGEKQDNWLQAHALLHSANRAWRVKVAHPKATYTKEEAMTAFNSTKAFMEHLASLL